MLRVLESMNLERPSKVQALSFLDILSGKHTILADQTGSGKTLGYLLPTLQRMITLRKQGVIANTAQSRSPLIVVVTPTTELASQVDKQVKALANFLKFRSASVTAASDMDAEQRKLRLGTDVLVSTPGRLQQLLKRNEICFDDLQAIVMDETDVLFMDETFPLQAIGAAVPPQSKAQFIFATATLPDIVTEQIALEFPDVVYRMGPGLHRIAPYVEEILVDCSGPKDQVRTPASAFENKRLALLRALESAAPGGADQRTLIFCNTIDQCRRVENALRRADRNEQVRAVLAYHGAIDTQQRQDNIREFSRGLLKQPVVLVCTDRASRGMDFDRARVDHVILFDFPKEPSEYVFCHTALLYCSSLLCL
jgi:ATP-dependent RNA helicase DDX18/HAS1